MKLLHSIFLLSIVAILVFAAYVSFAEPPDTSNKTKIVVYKSPSCGCCGAYSDYLKAKGFDVEIVTTNDMSTIKLQYGVPKTMESCHTSVVEGYFVEGHIPVESINKLLSDKPNIKGIALPNMPSGTPGMPGPKTEVWTIYSVNTDGTSGVFQDV
jgi:hypothetical protein